MLPKKSALKHKIDGKSPVFLSGVIAGEIDGGVAAAGSVLDVLHPSEISTFTIFWIQDGIYFSPHTFLFSYQLSEILE